MTAYRYRAVDREGRPRRGVVSAESAVAARRVLRRRHLSPVRVDAEPDGRQDAATGPRLPAARRAPMIRQMALMIGSGTPIEESLAVIGAQTGRHVPRQVFETIRARVAEGQSLGRAMRGFFPPLCCAAVSAGENAGALDSVLADLADYLEQQAVARRKLVAVLAYPAVLTMVAIGVAVALLVLVVPQLAAQLTALGGELPTATRFVLALSEGLRAFGVLLLAGTAILAFVAARALRLPSARRRRDAWLLGTPLLGPLLMEAETARFCRGLATLIAGGSPVMDAVVAARAVLGLEPLRDAAGQIARRLREGTSLSMAMAETEAFPALAVHMIRGGEASGELAEALRRVSQYADERFSAASALALALLEPAVTLLMAVLVLGIVMSVMLPLLRINAAILG